MKFRQAIDSLLYGFAVFFLLAAALPLWGDISMWIPFAAAVPLLYLHCRKAEYGPVCAGLIASLPGLFFPCYAYCLACFMWRSVLEARAEGGLYMIMTLGDPYAASTILRLLVMPSALVLGAGLLAGAMAFSVSRRLAAKRD